MSFSKMVAQTAQRTARNFSSSISKGRPSVSTIITTTAEEGGQGWLQSDGERNYSQEIPHRRDEVQQDYGRMDILQASDTSQFKPKRALQNALNEAREQMQHLSYNSGTVAAGVIMTPEAITLYSCGDVSVGLVFPESDRSDGFPINIKPPSGNSVTGKNGAILRVGGNSAIESKENFPTVEPVARLRKVYLGELQELIAEHGPAMAVVASDGVHTGRDIDYELLKSVMKNNDIFNAKQEMLIDAAAKGNSDNKTMYLDYVPESLENRVINVGIFDGHGRNGAAVAKSVSKSTISEIKEEVVRSTYRGQDEQGHTRG